MLLGRNKILLTMHQAWDVFLTVLAFVSAYLIRKYPMAGPLGEMSPAPNYWALLLFCVIVWYLVFQYSGVYRPFRRRASFFWVALDVVRSVAICVMVTLMVLFVIKEQTISRALVGMAVVLNVIFLVGSKWAIYRILRRLRKKGYNSRNVLVVGNGRGAVILARSLAEQPGTGFRLMGCVSVGQTLQDATDGTTRVPSMGKIEDLQRILTGHVVDELVFAEPLRNIPEVGKYIYMAEAMGIFVHVMPEWGLRDVGFEPRVGHLHTEKIFGLLTLSLSTTPDHRPSSALKNISDFVLSGVGLAVFALPFCLIALAIKISSSGPVFFRQERVGQNNRRFTLYKFRTMIEGADRMKPELLGRNESDGPVFKIRKDPRVVPWVGTFLRKTSLDELPQLINVLKGDISLVGPRPPLPEEITQYGPDQRRRLSMKPGITCLWQIAPRRNDMRFEDWVRLDLEYIDNWSLWLDFKILAKTAWVVITGQGR
ncbi:MAG: sugar transferase [Thermodesulfobacteriota bacterium]